MLLDGAIHLADSDDCPHTFRHPSMADCSLIGNSLRHLCSNNMGGCEDLPHRHLHPWQARLMARAMEVAENEIDSYMKKKTTHTIRYVSFSFSARVELRLVPEYIHKIGIQE